MSEFRFENVRLMLADANGHLRYGLKSALFQVGFREILDCGGFPPVLDAVTRNVIDVLMIDVDLPGGEACGLINQIRHHKVGNNPFLVAIAVTGTPTNEVVKRAIDAGADDLIIKPFSPEAMIQRVKTLARGRKPFVVTHDYIGPDRRKVQRDDPQKAPMLEVPNPLRSKAVANSDSSSLQRLIDAAAARINQHKMERYAVQIGYLADRIEPHFKEGRLATGDAAVVVEIVAHLRRLSFVAEDLGYRMRGTAYAHVAELALSLIGVSERILEAIGNPASRSDTGLVDHRDVELLPKIAQSLARAFSADKTTVEAAHQISTSVQNFSNRPDQVPAKV